MSQLADEFIRMMVQSDRFPQPRFKIGDSVVIDTYFDLIDKYPLAVFKVCGVEYSHWTETIRDTQPSEELLFNTFPVYKIVSTYKLYYNGRTDYIIHENIPEGWLMPASEVICGLKNIAEHKSKSDGEEETAND